jgi:hypothetical protein
MARQIKKWCARPLGFDPRLAPSAGAFPTLQFQFVFTPEAVFGLFWGLELSSFGLKRQFVFAV